jgi:carboxylate-amine ligase
MTAQAPLMGVEEEYLLVHPETRAAVPAAERVVARAATLLGDQVSHEITLYQVEARTPPCASYPELLWELRRMRRQTAAAARAEGVRLAALGSPVFGAQVPPPRPPIERYTKGCEIYGTLNDEQTICAMHVHIEVPDRETALLAGNHLRPWLPTLISMAANSPYWEGRDTGHASFRTLVWGRWPVAGPPPYFDGLAEYDDLVATLLDAGVLMDTATIFWDIRPSRHLPTLEVRAADVPLMVEDTALIAVLVRGLVGTALAAIDSGDRGPEVSPVLLRAAYWRAARDGLAGLGLDPVTGRTKEAADLVRAMGGWAQPALKQYGDLDTVIDGVRRLLAAGNGAIRQRAAFTRGGLTAVVDEAID